jgi:hypothetical protein
MRLIGPYRSGSALKVRDLDRGRFALSWRRSMPDGSACNWRQRGDKRGPTVLPWLTVARHSDSSLRADSGSICRLTSTNYTPTSDLRPTPFLIRLYRKDVRVPLNECFLDVADHPRHTGIPRCAISTNSATLGMYLYPH